MTKFRPCIDIHHGQVKQIVGGTLDQENPKALRTNFVSPHTAEWYAQRYAEDNLTGGHVIMLGEGNKAAALSALDAYPQGLQIGGGINDANALDWLKAGASHIILTSWLFSSTGEFLWNRLEKISQLVGKQHLVLDLSCRRTRVGWTVAMNRWQTLTNLEISLPLLDKLVHYCSEFLIHAADVEGLCQGIDLELVRLLGKWQQAPMTYAGGIHSLSDLYQIDSLSRGSIDATVGSALDLFGGKELSYKELLTFNSRTSLCQ